MLYKLFILCLIVSWVSLESEAKGGFRGGRVRFSSRSHHVSSKHTYPRSSGMSGSKSHNTHSYPPSSGLSGSGSHSYPPSSGLSGAGPAPPLISGNSHSYPSSPTGFSGSGYVNNNRNNNYHTQTGVSDNRNKYYPNQNYNTNFGHGGYGHGSYIHNPINYRSPPYVYVREYRDSRSPFGDILTGLALYNLMRSSSHQHVYYHDDYYRQRYGTYGANNNSDHKADARCLLKIKEKNKEQILKIPCEIVSTFIDSSTRISVNKSQEANCINKNNITIPVSIKTDNNITTNSSIDAINVSDANVSLTDIKPDINLENNNVTESVPTKISANASDLSNVNVTVTSSCESTLNATDPMSVQGPPVDASMTKCTVEIHTKNSLLKHEVDCKSLVNYAKVVELKKETRGNTFLPEKSTLKSWLTNPPWWLALFIAV